MINSSPKSLGPYALVGYQITLEPLSETHRDAVRTAASDPEIWEYLPINGREEFARWWQIAMTEPHRIAFAVRRHSDNAIVGSTSYLANTRGHHRVEIGWTWYVPEVQGTGVNPEAKLLLLSNAFDSAGYHRVELKTDSRNAKSNAAILKLGAKKEGVLREHMWMPRGYWRDTVYYSIVVSEWPAVGSDLKNRLGR
jgi:RimJ/RimL family protein N-acetyltransferase